MNIFDSLSKIFQPQPKRPPTLRELIQRESEIGGQLFGDVPKGHRREFFNLDRDTWVWHEEWKDRHGVERSMTTRYEVRPNGVLKVQDGTMYQYVSDEEARHLYEAAKLYHQYVMHYVYHRSNPVLTPSQ